MFRSFHPGSTKLTEPPERQLSPSPHDTAQSKHYSPYLGLWRLVTIRVGRHAKDIQQQGERRLGFRVCYKHSRIVKFVYGPCPCPETILRWQRCAGACIPSMSNLFNQLRGVWQWSIFTRQYRTEGYRVPLDRPQTEVRRYFPAHWPS